MRPLAARTLVAHDERGFSLVFVLIVAGMLLALATGLAGVVYLDTAVGNANERATRNLFAAEAGMNRGMAEFRNIFEDYREPTSGDYVPHTISFGGRTVRYQLSEPGTNPTQTTILPGQRFAGLNTILYSYNISSEALGASSDSQAQVRARFDVHNIPLFQFVAFFHGDLEILPGAVMNLHGRVHTNADLYLNSNNGTLTIEDSPPEFTNVQASAAGSIHRGRKNDTTCLGFVSIDRLADADSNNNLDPLELSCNGGPTRTVGTVEQANWLGNLISGVDEIEVPDVDIFARDPDATYWKNADLRIVLDLETDNSGALAGAPNNLKLIEVQQVNGTRDVANTSRLHTFMTANRGKVFYNDVPSPTCELLNGEDCTNSAARYVPPFSSAADVYRRADNAAISAEWANDLDYRRGGFWNNRELSWMYLLNIDMQALLQWNMAQTVGNRLFDPDDATGGGLVIFLSVKGPLSNGQNNYGVRVFDSAELPFNTTASADPTGLTVVSDQAIYVQGDYNCADPPNCTTKDPAAFMGDSINVLSQNWETSFNDWKSRFNLQAAAATARNRRATQTTIHAAFLGGADVTVPGVSYNGGLENFPRFHEKWSGLNFNYRGSFVSLDIPQHVDGPWCNTGGSTNASAAGPIVVMGCNIYDPPVRNFDYDKRFEQVANLPPLTPRVVFTEQQKYTQDFR